MALITLEGLQLLEIVLLVLEVEVRMLKAAHYLLQYFFGLDFVPQQMKLLIAEHFHHLWADFELYRILADYLVHLSLVLVELKIPYNHIRFQDNL